MIKHLFYCYHHLKKDVLSFCCSLLKSHEPWNCTVIEHWTGEYFRYCISVRCRQPTIHTKMFQVFACIILQSIDTRCLKSSGCFFPESKLEYINLLHMKTFVIFKLGKIENNEFWISSFFPKLINLDCTAPVCISSSESPMDGSLYFLLPPRYLKMVVFSSGCYLVWGFSLGILQLYTDDWKSSSLFSRC